MAYRGTRCRGQNAREEQARRGCFGGYAKYLTDGTIKAFADQASRAT